MRYAFLLAFLFGFSHEASLAESCTPSMAEVIRKPEEYFEALSKACNDYACQGRGSETLNIPEFEFNAVRAMFTDGGALNNKRKEILQYSNRKKCPDNCFQYNIGNVEAVAEPLMTTGFHCPADPLGVQRPMEFKSPEFSGETCQEVEKKMADWNANLLLGRNREGKILESRKPRDCSSFYATSNATAILTPSGCKGVMLAKVKFGEQNSSLDFKTSMRATHRWVCGPKGKAQ
jgi:hypothetical protein